MEALAGAWTTVTRISPLQEQAALIAFDSNAGSEALYLDNVYFTTSYVMLDAGVIDMRLDGYDCCPLGPTSRTTMRTVSATTST